jgi:hypothetical protein
MDINPVAVECRHERFYRLIPVGQQRGRAHRTHFAPNSKTEILSVQRWLNNKLRKCLGFKTPAEVFNAAGGCTC